MNLPSLPSSGGLSASWMEALDSVSPERQTAMIHGELLVIGLIGKEENLPFLVVELAKAATGMKPEHDVEL